MAVETIFVAKMSTARTEFKTEDLAGGCDVAGLDR